MSAEEIARALGGRRRGRDWMARCPAHEDKSPSLAIRDGRNGVVFYCHAGCPREGLIDGLKAGGLWPAVSQYREGCTVPAKRKRGTETRYEIRDEGGELIAVHVRRDTGNGKEMLWVSPDGRPGLNGRRVEELPLYGSDRLRELPDGAQLIVCEGENAAEAARQLGPAVGTVTGAGGVPGIGALRPLSRFRVLLWPDNDEAGRSHMKRIAERLTSLGVQVQILEWPEAPETGDAADFVARFGSEAAARFQELPRSTFFQEECGCAAVLEEVKNFIARFLVLRHEQLDALALWVVHTHCFEAAETTPYLHITSAEKRSGKTRLLELLSLLVAQPWFTSQTTTPVLVRKIEAEMPTLLLDESDTAFRGNREYAETLRGILNAGFRRGGVASRCEGQGAAMTYRDFSVYSPKAIAGIGHLPDTVADRSIRIELRRRAPHENVERFHLRSAQLEADPIRDRLCRLADRILPRLRAHRPALPEDLDDRAQDVWEPLLAIAELAGEDWTRRAHRAARQLSGWKVRSETESRGVRLLRDLRTVFGSRQQLSTNELLDELWRLEEAPWANKELNAERLAGILRRYGIRSRQWRDGQRRVRGYWRADCEDAWARYLPQPTRDTRDNEGTPCETNKLAVTGRQLPREAEVKPVTTQSPEGKEDMVSVTGVTGCRYQSGSEPFDAVADGEVRSP